MKDYEALELTALKCLQLWAEDNHASGSLKKGKYKKIIINHIIVF